MTKTIPTSTAVAADRGVVLDAWVAKRAEIARLEGEAADLLMTRAALFDADVKADPGHRDVMRRSMIAEHSAAARISKTATELAFNDAEAMAEYFPGLREALRDGIITPQHVRVIVGASAPVREAVNNGKLSADAIELYEAASLAVAEQDTPARTRVQAALIAATLAGVTVKERHRRALGERCVILRPLEDGLVLLTAVLPAIYGTAIMERLTALAVAIAAAERTLTEQEMGHVFADPADQADEGMDSQECPPPDDAFLDDPRPDTDPGAENESFENEASDTELFENEAPFEGEASDTEPYEAGQGDTTPPGNGSADADADPDAGAEFVAADGRTRRQIEADAFIDLLLASTPSEALGNGLQNITGTVQVTIAATTLAGEDDNLAELDGYGPIDPDHARDLAREAIGWNRLFLDHGGMVTEVDRYTPTSGMKRYLRARDQRCRFRGCLVPVARCEIDHNFDYAKGGLTEISNLSHFCPLHHTMKHPDIDLAHRWDARQLADGTMQWISPLGRTYTDNAPRRVMFI